MWTRTTDESMLKEDDKVLAVAKRQSIGDYQYIWIAIMYEDGIGTAIYDEHGDTAEFAHSMQAEEAIMLSLGNAPKTCPLPKKVEGGL